MSQIYHFLLVVACLGVGALSITLLCLTEGRWRRGWRGEAVALVAAAVVLAASILPMAWKIASLSAGIAEQQCERIVDATERQGRFVRLDHWNWDCVYDDGFTRDEYRGRLELDLLDDEVDQ